MNEPKFLSVRQIENFHRRGLELWGGSEGIRNRSLFKGAVAQAQNVYWYAQGDLFDIAAAYCFHIAQAQAFLDGNKRTAVAAGLTFLRINGVTVGSELSEMIYDAMIGIAKHELDRSGLAELLRKHLINR